MPLIIGFCGYAGSGKSTAAKYLEEKYKFKRVNFKDGLVAEMKERLPDVLEAIAKETMVSHDLDYKCSVDELFEHKPPIMRALMQNYGTEVRRRDDSEYWVKKWVESVNNLKYPHIVVDDVRFFNELSALVEMDGILIRITRPDITSAGSHASETEQTKFVQDFLIEGEPNSHYAIYKQLDEVINIIKSNHD